MFSCFARRLIALLNRTHLAAVPSRTHRPRPRHGTFRPCLQILEDRMLLSATLPVSIATSGTVMGNGSASADLPAVSANGQYAAFVSNSTDLVKGVTIQNDSGPGAGWHIYWRNLSNGTTALVDVATSGTVSGNHSARFPSITADGRYVAFVGYENNLTSNDASATQPQIYVRDMQLRKTYMVSLGIGAVPQNGGPNETPTPSISKDGKGHLLIAYQSNATNLTKGDSSSNEQIFLALVNLASNGAIEYSTLKTTLVSAASSGNGGNGDSLNPLLSKDGSTLTFNSYAANLNVPGGYSDNSGVDNLYQYSLANRTLSLLSAEPTTTTAATGNGTSEVYNGLFNSSNQNVAPQSISANGQYVVFSSYAANLVPGLATYNWDNVYRRDLVNGTTSLVSINAAGTGGAGAYNHATHPVMTPDGRYIAFDANDGQGDLTSNDPGGSNVFVRDMQQGRTYLVSLGMNGSAANGGSGYSTIAETGNGQLVIAYQSKATNLTNGDTNGNNYQIFVTTFALDANGDIEFNTLSTKMASADNSGTGNGANGNSSNPLLSKDGSTLAFVSTASNLPGESGTGTQLFAYKVASGALTQVSPAGGGNVGNALGISDNGQFIAYHYTPSSDDEVLAWNANTGTNTVIDDQEIENNPLNVRNTNFGGVQISGDGSTIAYKVGDVFGHNWFEAASNWQSGSPGRTTISPTGQVFTPSSPSISISENGQVIAYQFEYTSSNNPFLFVYANGTNTQVGSGGTSGGAGTPIVSADGSTVAFNYTGNDLVSGITDFIPGQDNVFAYNVVGNTVSLVSAKAPGVFTTDQNINGVSVSDTGRYLAYYSAANDLLGGSSSTANSLFAEDVQQGVPTVVAGPSFTPVYAWVLSGDGGTVAFQSGKQIYSSNWLAATPTTTLVSVSTTGGTGNGYSGSSDPSISDNGQVIAFQSDANNLTANDPDANGYTQIFVRNLAANTTTLASPNSAGTDGGNGSANTAVLSGDGSTVIYNSSATNLVAGVTVPTTPNLYGYALTANHFVISVPTVVVAGASFHVKITAENVLNKVITNYNGTVQLTSSDPKAVLPSSITFINGVATVSVTLNTAGTRTLTVTDTGNPDLTNTSAGMAVYLNISSDLQVTRGTLLYNSTTQEYSQTVTLTNISQLTFNTGIALLLTNLSSNATLANAKGKFNGDPYLDLATPTGGLKNGMSITVTLYFKNPTGKSITYGTEELQGKL